MLMDPVFSDLITELRTEDPRYADEAYLFVAQAVQNALLAARRVESRARHITASEIVETAGAVAASEYGALAEMVLADWGIKTNTDISNIVYKLIGANVFAAGPDDAPEQFDAATPIVDVIHQLTER